MYIASMNFGDYRKGDEVPENLPNNDERLARGLIREVKVIKPEEVKVVEVKTVTPEEPKAAKNVVRKPKSESKQAE